MNKFKNEEYKIKETYKSRKLIGKHNLYSWYLPDVLLQEYSFKKSMSELLKESGILSLTDLQILDVGCGAGRWLRSLLEWGAAPENLHGIDLVADRIEQAQAISPQIDFNIASGWSIPFDDSSIDMVTANTVFSSILSPEARSALSNEMKRVIKPTGIIMIYDFRVSHPANPDTVGIRKAEIQRLFHGYLIRLKFHRF